MGIQLKAFILQNGPPSDSSRRVTAHPSEGSGKGREARRSTSGQRREASRACDEFLAIAPIKGKATACLISHEHREALRKRLRFQ
ncbi:hypothetical protein BHE74_00020923 [Ensete ventricosum]|nr:hypothetical protein GW17_00001288 [Ensete ventricosum]RWW71346.1 hypothetical protein BHE74_00020923 [Ensete ventricosum]RZR90415.1 hypothetical protein BHM03_00018281 [Ensete ventricosum]